MLKVVLGPRAPGNAQDVELVQVVEEYHLPALRPCADPAGPSVGLLPGGVHDSAGGQEAAGIQLPVSSCRCSMAAAWT